MALTTTNPAQLMSTWNYLVPASGTTNAYALPGLVAAGDVVDFSQIGVPSGVPFNPTGVLIDNLTGTVPVVVKVAQIGFSISCPVGKQMGMQFPAPSGCSVQVTANGANLAFVDYPVLPYLF